MKKILFFFLIFAFSAAAHSLEFKGFPTSVQINEDKSLLVLLNDDYDFSVYSVFAENGELACERKSNLGKKDVSDTSYELRKAYTKKAKTDYYVQEFLGREKLRRESEFLKKNGWKSDFM